MTYGGATHNLTTKPSGEKEYTIADHLGSTRVVLSTAGMDKTYDYEPFGGVIAQTGINSRLSFIDKEKDAENGLGDFGVRKYDDDLGRFLSVDPLWEKFRGWSPYHYSYNNPVRLKDESGDIPRVYTETSGSGHSWISVGEGKNMIVYTFGRYAGTNEEWHGINTLSNGPGVMVKLTGADAEAYNQKKFDKTGATIFQIQDVSDESIQKIMDDKFATSTQLPSKGEYKDDTRAHILGEYKLLGNNCTTLICDALNATGSKATERLPNKNGEIIKDRFVLPISLQSFFNWQATSYLGNHTVKIQEEIKPKAEQSK